MSWSTGLSPKAFGCGEGALQQVLGVTLTTAERSGHVYMPPIPEEPGYDADGNLTSDGRWDYAWDGEILGEDNLHAFEF